MTPPPETLVAVQDSVPSLAGAMLRLGVATALIAAAAWAWFHWQRKVKAPSRRLEVIERAWLARGSGVALIRVLDRQLLVGMSGDGVRLIRDLGARVTDEPAEPRERFGDVLKRVLPSREAVR